MVNLADITVSDLIGSTDTDGSSVMGRRSQILSFVRQHQDGVTAKFVSNHIGISSDRSRQILDELVYLRELYKRELPEKVNLYYPNGKLIHKYLQDSKDIGNQIFRISFHEGRNSPKIQIQERKYTLLDGEKVEGSIFIDSENIEDFIEFINQMRVKFYSFKTEGKE